MSTEATRPSSPKRQRTTGPDSAAMADESKSNSSSWVKYDADCEFPIQNIPFGVFKPTADAASRIGTAIGDQVGSCEAGAMWVLRCAALTHHALSVSVSCFQVVDLSALAKAGLFDSAYAGMLSEVRRCHGASWCCLCMQRTHRGCGTEPHHTVLRAQSSLNTFMGAGRPTWRAVRSRLIELFSVDNAELRDNAALRAAAMFPQSSVCCGLLFGGRGLLQLMVTCEVLRSSWSCLPPLVTTPTSTHRASTPPTWAPCSVVKTTRCSPTGAS